MISACPPAHKPPDDYKMITKTGEALMPSPLEICKC